MESVEPKCRQKIKWAPLADKFIETSAFESLLFRGLSFIVDCNSEINIFFQSVHLCLCMSMRLSVNKLTRGQSNLTKSASQGPIPRLGVTPGGRKLYH